MSDTVNQQTTPFERLGGADRVRSIGERFYEVMDADEPALAAVHKLDANGRVSREARDRFILFFIGWLGGPQDYVVQHGHPRLRGRHASVRVDLAQRDAWLRCMKRAMDDEAVTGDLRAFLDERLADLANHLRNVAE